MSNIIIANPGQIKGAGDRLAMFLKIFTGEILTAYARLSVTEGRHQERTISNGKSAVFPITGRTQAQYLGAGMSLDDIRKIMLHNETTILIDGLLTADCLITDIDEAMSSFEVRGVYTTQMGEALAMAKDGAVLAEIAKMVVAGVENLAGLGKPSIIAKTATGGLSPISATVGNLYLDALLEMKTNLDNNYVSAMDRVAYCTPDVISALIKGNIVIDQHLTGTGSITEGTVQRVAGFDLVPTVAMTRGGADIANIAQGDGHVFPVAYKDTCKIIACHRSCVGILKLKDLAVEHGRRIEYQSDQIVAKYAHGYKGLRPEACQMCTLTLS